MVLIFYLLMKIFMDFRMDYGEWSKNSRAIYNKWDAVSRTTTQVLSQI